MPQPLAFCPVPRCSRSRPSEAKAPPIMATLFPPIEPLPGADDKAAEEAFFAAAAPNTDKVSSSAYPSTPWPARAQPLSDVDHPRAGAGILCQHPRARPMAAGADRRGIRLSAKIIGRHPRSKRPASASNSRFRPPPADQLGNASKPAGAWLLAVVAGKRRHARRQPGRRAPRL